MIALLETRGQPDFKNQVPIRKTSGFFVFA
jgi:hypothetical protein